MERRDFLKILGLGGMALTLPKPLSVVAAKMKELEAPPLHAGHVEVGPLADDARYFIMDRLGVAVERTLPVDRCDDYCQKWAISVFTKFRIGDKTSRTTLFSLRASNIPDPLNRLSALYLPTGEQVRDGKAVQLEDFLYCPWRYRFMPGESLEFWFTPASHVDLPKFPLPRLTVSLLGHMIYKEEPQRTGRDYVAGGRVLTSSMWGEVQTLRLERAKAIELGIVAPAEPEGIIV